MLTELKGSMAKKQINLIWDDLLVNAVVKKSFGGKFGARDLRKNVRREVEDRIAQMIVDLCDTPIKTLSFSAQDDAIVATAI